MSLQKINWSQIDTDPFFGDVDLGTQENYLKNVYAENLFVSGITAGTVNVENSNILTKISGGTDISVIGNQTGITINNTNPDQIVTISGGTGILTGGTYPNFTIRNTAPDVIVTISGGTGILTGGTYPNFTIENTAPDQTVTISGGTGILTGGTYPNFTIENTAPDQIVTISGGTGILTGGTYPNFTIENTSPDQTVTISGGTNIQITGTYPNFGVNFTGTTGIGGDFLPISGGTLTGTLSGTTISGDTFFGNGSGLTNVNLFTNTATTTTDIGGIASGTTLLGKTVQEIWDLLFFPYETPAFTSFNVNPTLPIFELGQSVTAGTKTYSWGIQNSQNLSANTLSIIEYTGTSQFRTISSGLTGTSKSITTTPPTFSSATPTTQVIYNIKAYDTQGNLFTRSISGTWRYRWYYGKYSGSSITSNEITGLTTALVSNVTNNYITLSPTLNPEYGYFIIPTGLTQPTDLRNSTSGCQGSNIPYSNEGTILLTNLYGISVTYNIYKTSNLFAGSTNVWFCT